MIKAFRMSKTSLKSWGLYGPIDQALKTTLQAEGVRVMPLHLSHDGTEMEVEMWINADEDDERHGFNPAATAILALQDVRSGGGVHTSLVDHDEDGDPIGVVMASLEGDVLLVNGPAILTGPGGTDIPDVHLDCLMEALLSIPED